MLNADNWGTININYEYFLNDQNKINDLTEAVNHEVQHFFRYLVRLNFENWEYFNNYANTLHSDLNMDNIAKTNIMDAQDKLEYYLNEDEFDTLSSTYIAYLKKCFKKIQMLLMMSILIHFYMYFSLNLILKMIINLNQLIILI